MKKVLIAAFGVFSVASYAKWSMNDPYVTHQPILYEIARKTTGPIIEFGCGNGSTDLLHEICKKDNRILISIDDDFNWLNKFSQKYLGDGYEPDNLGWHKFYYVPGKKDNINPEHWIKFFEEFELLKTLNFDVCFIDQSPWLARYETIKMFRHKARYVILHDCNYFPEQGIFGKVIKPLISATCTPGVFDFSDVFAYFKVYFPPCPWPGPTGPPTLLGSNFESDLPDIDYEN